MNNSEKISCIAVCLFGMESSVSYELKMMGIELGKVRDGRVGFYATAYEIAKANIFLRTAERVLIHVGSFKAQTFEELYQGIKKLPFENYLSVECQFPIAKAKSLKSKLFSIPDIQSVSKKAVVDRLRQAYPNIKKFEEKGEVYPIHIFLMKDDVEVTIDTTGPALHKRGYRERSGTAPLRETIAACMVMLTPWKKDRILLDPMCGSGTILIEAAMIGANIQPGVNRNFIGEKFHFLPKEDWMRARQDAIEGENMDVEMALYGSDIDEQVIELAKENAALAGVEEYITFSVQDMSEVRRSEEYGFLITNPPYGERIGEKEELEKTYCDLGKTISTLKNWSAFLITNYENTEKCIGKKATKKRKLYNGLLKTVYYQFPGTKPPKKTKLDFVHIR